MLRFLQHYRKADFLLLQEEDQDFPFEFPCEFPIKAMGLAEGDFDCLVVSLIREHCPDLPEGAVTSRLSRGERYVSVTVTITARNRAQLDRIYQALSDEERVLMVL